VTGIASVASLRGAFGSPVFLYLKDFVILTVNDFVILSEDFASLREAKPQSKDLVLS
jgi:hypothetical protein